MKYLLFFILFFISCNSVRNYKLEQPSAALEETSSEFIDEIPVLVYPYRYSAEDSIYIDWELYEVNEDLYIILDSVIDARNRCSPEVLYVDEFAFSVNEKDGNTYLNLSHIYTHEFIYNGCSGYFMYKEYRFNCVEFNNQFLKKTGKSEKLRCVSSEVILIDYDDSGLYWEYILEDDRLRNIRYRNCFYIHDEENDIFLRVDPW